MKLFPLLTLPLLIAACSPVTDDGLSFDESSHETCLTVLRDGLNAKGKDDFWASIHAAEALTLAGKGDEVRAFLEPKLETEKDDQKRVGLSREMVRAGDREKAEIMLGILKGDDRHGFVHAAESLYKVGFDGDEAPLVKHFRSNDDPRLLLMTAAALAKHGSPEMKKEGFATLRSVLEKESDPATYRLPAWVLGRIGDSSDIPRIRARIPDTDDPLVEAFLYHSIGLLGDEEGRKKILTNLQSDDAAIRTYAAVFAGESGITEAASFLTKQLDDEDLDARIRAAQALIVLSQ